MVEKFCARSHGQPVPAVRSAAIISMRRVISREGVIFAIQMIREAGYAQVLPRQYAAMQAACGAITSPPQAVRERSAAVLPESNKGRASMHCRSRHFLTSEQIKNIKSCHASSPKITGEGRGARIAACCGKGA